MNLDRSSIKILLVEDAATMRKIERKTLASLGFENVTEAGDGDEAIARFQEDGPFDLVVSDWNMPHKSGYDLLLWVRANDATRRIPFIMATGQHSPHALPPFLRLDGPQLRHGGGRLPGRDLRGHGAHQDARVPAG